ncbi:uncharacterized protein TNCV_4091841 [Trichonephila clavipes]|nr:uncharacterized protein TNCV_4091841 [Trichonephila clavipes]
MKRKENFQWLPKEFHQLKYEAISVPQGSVRLVKKTQERKSSTCYLLITKGVTCSSPVPLKTRRERERTLLMLVSQEAAQRWRNTCEDYVKWNMPVWVTFLVQPQRIIPVIIRSSYIISVSNNSSF